ncbi:hypothetical protein [Gimesia maris]|uniref:Uncharacterized protein n=1 Tax=Gimesia maris TaxID=122 RepID=A0ABX5YKP6_9PLAN|nr:hypothetical protein [Gimesia maris]EDL57098.1 hypothetical protein PM8797T_01859 [Gimesia maris DSM 8797]QDT78670.1 hypothetical protein Mal35_21200 [Gimesia maris]QDU14205.1 hypothetical protein CA11_20100 [Gimesia maris]QEG16185.1 hypothetical protein GmarT_20470 [Gimesia maris]QGQ30597.1 hypothetical protein F1729_19130 [Gimesia maris]
MSIEEFQQALSQIVAQFQNANYDARHLLLDLSEKIQELSEQIPETVPAHLRSEWKSICNDVDAVQPAFKSHRKTSILFDRQGMGLPGVQTAKALITRIVALSKLITRLTE